MDSKHEKRGKNDRNRTALAIACAAAIPALGTLFVASAEGQHREVAGPPATSPATVEPVAAEPLVLVPDDGAGTDAPDGAQRFELPLKPGEFEWHPEASPAGDVVMLVSLPMQEIHVYRGDVRIGRASISSARLATTPRSARSRSCRSARSTIPRCTTTRRCRSCNG